MQCCLLPLFGNKLLFYNVLAPYANSARVNANLAGTRTGSGAPAMPIYELQLQLDSRLAAGCLKLPSHSRKAVLAG